jgi:hypothetical protein
MKLYFIHWMREDRSTHSRESVLAKDYDGARRHAELKRYKTDAIEFIEIEE